MDGAAPVELPRYGQPTQRPVQGIQGRGLRIGEEGRAHKDVRVPEGDAPVAQRGGGVVSVGIEVVEDVAAGQHPIGKEKAIEQKENEERQ